MRDPPTTVPPGPVAAPIRELPTTAPLGPTATPPRLIEAAALFGPAPTPTDAFCPTAPFGPIAPRAAPALVYCCPFGVVTWTAPTPRPVVTPPGPVAFRPAPA